jgi:hypothetical protein
LCWDFLFDKILSSTSKRESEMFGLKDIDSPAYKNELRQQLDEAMRVKNRHQYLCTINIHRTWFKPNRFYIGFNFRKQVSPGDIYYNDDGSRSEVLALI